MAINLWLEKKMIIYFVEESYFNNSLWMHLQKWKLVELVI